jgi:hypothetical protein
MATTQQISNTDDVYVSIYDKPKRGKGRPKSSLTDEEKAQKKRDNQKKWYNENWQYKCLKERIRQERIRHSA